MGTGTSWAGQRIRIHPAQNPVRRSRPALRYGNGKVRNFSFGVAPLLDETPLLADGATGFNLIETDFFPYGLVQNASGMANDPGLGHILNPESTQGEVGCGNPNAATTTAPVRPNQGWVSQDKSDPVEGMKQGAAIAGAGYLAHNAAKLIPHPIGRGIVMGLADVAMVFGGLKTAYHIVEWTVQEVKKAIGGTTGTTGGTSTERPAVVVVMLMRIKTTRPRTTGRPAAATLPSLILTMGATHLERVAEMTRAWTGT